jgi:hypothetical protein
LDQATNGKAFSRPSPDYSLNFGHFELPWV